MRLWQLKLRVRRAACEGRLGFARERHSDIVIERNRAAPGSETWKKKSEKLALLRWQIRRELDEIGFIRQLTNAGPIAGNSLTLEVKRGGMSRVTHGPTIIDLMNRNADYYDSLGPDAWVPTTKEVDAKYHAVSVAEGIAIALRILSNPYLYLDREERTAYDKAESNADKIVSRGVGETKPGEMILPGTSTAASLAKIKSSDGGGVVVRRRKAD